MEDTDFHADRAREGDATGFSTLYGRLAPALYAWARFRLHGPMRAAVDAEDIVQEVWWRALEAFPGFQPRGPGAFRAWIFSIATNVFRELARRRSPSRNARVETLPPDLSAEITSITRNLARNDEATRLIDDLSRLDDDDRRLVLHCGLEGLTARDAAPLLGISAEAVKKRWQRLRVTLADRPAWAALLESA